MKSRTYAERTKSRKVRKRYEVIVRSFYLTVNEQTLDKIIIIYTRTITLSHVIVPISINTSSVIMRGAQESCVSVIL